MLFTDDAAICATTEEELQTIITIFNETLTEFGLKLAIKNQKSASKEIHKIKKNLSQK